jgi:phosphonate degradation associated HDIG domain protein
MRSGRVIVVDRILGLLTQRGERLYGGEAVTQLEHALQTAALARREQAPRPLVAAAMLHDIGHLLDGPSASLPSADDEHESRGAAFLRDAFREEVVEPIALHVMAKRYLCGVEPAYFERLSPESVRSLQRQGGPLPRLGCELFRRQPYWEDAVRLRRWDDLAKVPGLSTPPLDDIKAVLDACLRD